MFISIYLVALYFLLMALVMTLMVLNAATYASRIKLNNTLIDLLTTRANRLAESRDMCFGLARDLGGFTDDQLKRWDEISKQEAILPDRFKPQPGGKSC